MADSNDGNRPVDLRERLGLHKKLAEIEKARKAGEQPQQGEGVPSEEPTEIQQPPRPQRARAQPQIMNEPTEVVDIDLSSVGGKPKALLIGGSALIIVITLLAGYTIGKAFQMRSIANTRVENAKSAYTALFTDTHPDAKKEKMKIVEDYVAEAKKACGEILALKKDASKRDALLASLGKLVETARKYRALNVDFPARRVATGTFFFAEILPSLLTLQQQLAHINVLSDALMRDGALLEMVARVREDRAANPDKYRFHFRVDAPKDPAADEYAQGVRVLRLGQKEKVKSGRTEQMEQTLIAEDAQDTKVGQWVPMARIAEIRLSSIATAIEDQMLDRMLGQLLGRVEALGDAAKAFNPGGLKKRIEEQASKPTYFVL